MMKNPHQGSRMCGSTGAALLGNGRPNWGNDANWEKKGEIRKEKGQMGNEVKRWKEKEGKREEKDKKRDEDKILLKIIE